LLTEIEKKQLKRGIIIAFEGIDGAGKTTQASRLCEKLEKMKYPIVLFHEPTGGEWGKKIAELAKYGRDKTEPRTEFEFFYRDRIEDVRENIVPSLKEKKIVVMDRYYLSSVAYQGARGLDPKIIEKENEKIAPKPDMAIILDLSAEVALSRIKNKRNSEPNHFEKTRYLEKVREIFLKMYESCSYVKIVKGDDTRAIEDITSEIWEVVFPIISREEV
jgi:dTMP kinase